MAAPIPTSLALHSIRRTTRLITPLTNNTLSTSSSYFSFSYSYSSMTNNNITNNPSGLTCAATSSPSPPTKTVRVTIKGRVQGVFYRNWTIENARGLGLKGWVRNRRDGSVEALFSGDPDSVSEMEQRCRRGPPDALVTALQVYPSDEDPGKSFDRKPTA